MKKVERRFSYEMYIIAVIITCIFFALGLIVGKQIAYKKTDDVAISQKAISAFLDLSMIKSHGFSSYMNEDENFNYCNLSWSDIWTEKVEIGTILTALELRLGKTNKRVIEQKKIYNEVQFRTLELVNKVNTECNYNWTIISFFYTNDEKQKKSAKLSELQGYTLDTLYNMDKENIKIFSFDTKIKTNSTDILIKKYNLTYIPSVVIDETVYGRFMSRNELVQHIQK